MSKKLDSFNRATQEYKNDGKPRGNIIIRGPSQADMVKDVVRKELAPLFKPKPRGTHKPKREQKGFRMIVVYKALEKKLRAYSNKGYPHYDHTVALKELRVVKKYIEIIGDMKNASVLRGFRKWKYDPLRKRTD